MGTRSLRKDSIVMGFALFAMFFGAGNLIFPPQLGAASGELWPLGLAGFLLTDAVLACVGLFVVNAAGGAIGALDMTLGKRMGTVLSAAAVICLGALFAMPRTAATTYEMAVAPWIGADPGGVGLPLFSVAFFAVTFLLSMRESRIMDIIGRFFTPTLVAGVLLLVGAGILMPLGMPGAPTVPAVFQQGVRSGYQTMDVLGVVAFSVVLVDSIRAMGYADRASQMRIIGVASALSVLLLAIIYGGLAYVGATAQGMAEGTAQAQLIVAATRSLLGEFGLGLLGVVVTLACLTTAVALVGSTAAYFHRLSGNRLSYRWLVAADCLIGLLVCNFGLEAIVSFADPVLGVACPPLVTVIVLLLFRRLIRHRSVYQGAAAGAVLAALALEAHAYGMLPLPVEWLPLYDLGFGWAAFAVAGGIAGWAWGRIRACHGLRARDCADAPALGAKWHQKGAAEGNRPVAPSKA